MYVDQIPLFPPSLPALVLYISLPYIDIDKESLYQERKSEEESHPNPISHSDELTYEK
jgi:hypothetical protein